MTTGTLESTSSAECAQLLVDAARIDFVENLHKHKHIKDNCVVCVIPDFAYWCSLFLRRRVPDFEQWFLEMERSSF